MKTIISTVLAVAGAALFGACERHEWEDTKALYEHHGDEHGDAHGDSHADPHHGDTHSVEPIDGGEATTDATEGTGETGHDSPPAPDQSAEGAVAPPEAHE